MLQDVKSSVRIINNNFDVELLDLIEAAKMDLLIAGVIKKDEDDMDKFVATLHGIHDRYENTDEVHREDEPVVNYYLNAERLAACEQYIECLGEDVAIHKEYIGARLLLVAAAERVHHKHSLCRCCRLVEE